ncbi:tRNA epoxyqueuosine(34) reductase QueG [Lichenibacterium dinghuense]|uniref:tRNA epoxyqueuosine(34) reductase QueG n=1 Tax=Lichenibacterium dinghuense TaxID=2895977 RepID=UPI001F008AB7|nr:tRNA epoxyqueuosine(34) reductase QueG [Lichenibacterium sp. 6Y81]
MVPDLKSRIAARALALGFDGCRVAAPDAAPEAAGRLRAWLAAGRHGTMGWMADTAERRGSPAALWADVRSVIMLGLNYGPEVDPRAVLARRGAGAVSVYARHRDYHDVVKGKLKDLAGFVARQGGGADVKVFVDTAPVMEKPLAEAAGLGWAGKHTNLVSRDFGSWLFLGSVFTTLPLEPDLPGTDACGSCRACLDACPTGAFPAPRQLDARRCISYLTIEHKGTIDRALRPLMGNRIYGCDDCLAACPWNKFAVAGRDAKLRARDDLAAPSLDALSRLDDAGFRALFSGSPIKRIGVDRFLRNVLIAIGNSGDAALAPRAAALLAHPSPLVRAMAVWAGRRLVGTEGLALASPGSRATERDAGVLAEWEHP